MKLQSAIHALYPPQCLTCGAETAEDFSLCGGCWREMPFITGLVCDACGVPLAGEGSGERVHCDACMMAPHLWSRGRAPLLYQGTARSMILAFKHGDRHDYLKPMAQWMVMQARVITGADVLIAPVPLHRHRLFRRRFNQAALLGARMARLMNADFCPDLLIRTRATRPHQGMSRVERFENQRAAYQVPQSRQKLLKGRELLLVDDVMTSGATLAACAEACFDAGVLAVNVTVLARVASDT
ncbi:MAG: ComF family protein [Rhodobacteraceae bacterium]|nr:ComF family protein [Paracoccaceae bacterium]